MDKVVIKDCTLYQGDCLAVLAELAPGSVDAIICDPPFSDVTHNGHRYGGGNDGCERSPLAYASWSKPQIDVFIEYCHRVCRGWVVVMTDHVLAPLYRAAYAARGRTTFAPLPYYAPGRSCRLTGDGPSSWTDWIVVSRTTAQHKWGTLPGGYVKQSHYGDHAIVGGKPVGLMVDLINDYSKPGATIMDPTMGAGTTALACICTGRKFIGCDIKPEHFALACQRIEEAYGKDSLFADLEVGYDVNSDLFSGVAD